MNRRYTTIAGAGLTALLFLPSLGLAQSLGSAATFAVLAGSTVTNTGLTTIVGNVGVSPGTAITGIPAGQPTGGSQHSNDAAAIQAQVDLALAHVALGALVCGGGNDLTGQDLGGKTLLPGVYCFDTTAGLTGALTLDGGGDPNAVFVIKVGSALTTASTSAVNLIGGAQSPNVYWRVGSSATLGTTSNFKGNILAQESITLTNGVALDGRALAITGAVTMDTNILGNATTPSRKVTWGEIKSIYR